MVYANLNDSTQKLGTLTEEIVDSLPGMMMHIETALKCRLATAIETLNAILKSISGMEETA
jgi:hypothetical protein